jgi:hypothetical protein
LIIYCVLCLTTWSFTHMEKSPLSVKGFKIEAYAWRSGHLRREGSLLCHTCCDMGPWFLQSHPNDCPILLPLMTCKGILRTYSNLDAQEMFYTWSQCTKFGPTLGSEPLPRGSWNLQFLVDAFLLYITKYYMHSVFPYRC